MPNVYSLTTFSGLVVCFATIALLYRRFTIGALMLIMDGTGGTAIFWDRWSKRAGDQVHLDSLFSAVHPSNSEMAMLVTHLPLAIVGLIILALLELRRRKEGGRNDGPQATLAKGGERTSHS